MDELSKELKLSWAKDITLAFVRNEAARPTPKEAADMMQAIYDKLDEMSPANSGRKVGLS
jgi:hypothetical protein